jgi:hypothetical protein
VQLSITFVSLSTFVGAYCKETLGLGVQDKRIPDNYLTASSEIDSYAAPSEGRLHNKNQAWQPKYLDSHPYFQVFLGNLTMVTQIATQGHPWEEEFVMKYTVQHSADGQNWINYMDNSGEDVVSV